MTFLVVFLDTQAKTAKLTSPTLQTSPTEQKFPLKIDFLLCLGVHLENHPYKLRQKFFLPFGGAFSPSAPPGYA